MRDELANQASGTMLGKIEGAKREKTWAELGIEEKVERLRNVMQSQRHTVNAAYSIASAASDLARQHQHNQTTGAVLAEVNRHGGGAESMGRSFDPLA